MILMAHIRACHIPGKIPLPAKALDAACPNYAAAQPEEQQLDRKKRYINCKRYI